jgi:HAD superfamily hydrolase (TIGR01458 family)
MKKIKPVLIDFDGVIKIGNELASEAYSFFKYLSKNNIPFCILSNSTLRTSELVSEFLLKKNIVYEIPILTAFDATLEFVKKNYSKVKVYCRDNLIKHFNELLDDNNPQAVVIGDIGNKWSYETLNEMFRYVLNGADIVAMHKNKFWKPDDEIILDVGAFVTAIEFASGKEAFVIGKPSKIYFNTALEKLGFNLNNDFIMIGDDLENDVIASQKIGGTGILILTGKTKLSDIKDLKPDFIANSLNEVCDILHKI